jgi:tRNA A37 methylthiotransferase MiaB
MITPRYSCIFIRRYCPRSCGYCLAKDVRGEGKLLKPEQWSNAIQILEDNGVNFHLILGNELRKNTSC